MAEALRRLRILVSSPGDVADERARVAREVDFQNENLARDVGLELELVRWETHATPGVGADAQDVLNPPAGVLGVLGDWKSQQQGREVGLRRLDGWIEPTEVGFAGLLVQFLTADHLG